MGTPAETPAQIRNGTVVGAIDPTENVKSLVLAGFDRVDDLLAERDKRFSELRIADQAYISAEFRRMAELEAAESRRVDEQAELREQIASLRAEQSEKLRVSEAARVDANRAEDKAAAQLAAERLAVQVTALATTQTTTAETLRGQVGTAAASQQQQVINPLLERLLQVEQTIAKGQGRAQETDPAMSQMAADMRALRTEQTSSSSRGAGANQLWVYLVAGLGVLFGLIGAAVGVTGAVVLIIRLVMP